jgi:HPt (histidine-containing phosphotransfer) domain-containing protein
MTTFDPAALKNVLELGGGDREFVVEVIDEYLNDSAELLARLRCADGEDLRRAAHSLKSTSASVGATALADVCGEIEREGTDPGLVDTAEREHAAARAALVAQRAAYA